MPEYRILVSSPDASVRDFLAEGLSEDDFDLLPACLPRDVVEVVLDQSPDILVFEIDRRHGSPAESLRILRKMRPSLRIVALSESSCPEDAEIVEVGIFYYTTKPVGRELLEVIEAAARASGGRAGHEDR